MALMPVTMSEKMPPRPPVAGRISFELFWMPLAIDDATSFWASALISLIFTMIPDSLNCFNASARLRVPSASASRRMRMASASAPARVRAASASALARIMFESASPWAILRCFSASASAAIAIRCASISACLRVSAFRTSISFSVSCFFCSAISCCCVSLAVSARCNAS